MKYAIDETELARLEELACAAGDADYSAHDDADDSTKYAAAACNAVPALIAEVRRMREKVEAWEWYEECRKCLEWLDETCCSSTPFREAEATYLAAREGIHADSE